MDAYVFVEGDQRHFLGEAVLGAIAVKVLSAFLRGFVEAAESRVEDWGRQAGEWLFDRVDSLTGADEKPAAGQADEELRQAAEGARAVVVGSPPDDVARYAGASEEIMRKVLAEHGLTAAAAERVAAATREAALAAVER